MKVASKVAIVLTLLVGLRSVDGLAQSAEQAPIDRFDPALSVAEPTLPALSSGPQIVVDRDEREANVELHTKTPIVPYLGAERRPELSKEEQRLLGEDRERGPLAGYHLEAGVGLLIEDKTSLNLGYRFHDRPTLLDDRRNDPRALSGDLRLSIDFKVPF